LLAHDVPLSIPHSRVIGNLLPGNTKCKRTTLSNSQILVLISGELEQAVRIREINIDILMYTYTTISSLGFNINLYPVSKMKSKALKSVEVGLYTSFGEAKAASTSVLTISRATAKWLSYM
jgi:hypothetical protein